MSLRKPDPENRPSFLFGLFTVEAGMLKRPGISVADAIIAASARLAGAAVVTNDPHFSALGVEVSGYP